MKKKHIYIFGSGGFAKEVFFLIQEINQYEFMGFIGLETSSITIGKKTYPILKESEFINSLKENNQFLFALGTGDPFINKKIIKKLNCESRFPNLIHPNFIGNISDIEFGYGNIITAGNIFTTSIKMGSFNIVNLSCTVGHDTIIGSLNVFNPSTNISGGVKILNENLLGTNATVLQYLSIGNNNIIGASSLITKNIAHNKLVIGVPGKIIREI